MERDSHKHSECMRIWYHHPVKLIIKSSFYSSNDYKCSSFTGNVNFKYVRSSVLFFHDVSYSSLPEGLPQFFLFVCFVLFFLRNNDMHNGFRHTHTQTFKISRHPHSCKLFLPIFFEDKRKSIILLCFSKIIFCSLRIFLT